MIVMALDHTRDFFHASAMVFQPEDLARTTPVLFFTRWITHFCAPVFMFTAGLGAYYQIERGRTRGELSRFLWTRGLWLIFLELTAIRFAMHFTMLGSLVILEVIWALGWSMIALAGLIHLPVRWLATLSILTIALHNLADPVRAGMFGKAGWIWNLVHELGVIPIGGFGVVTSYPLFPWVAVMSAGFCFGYVRRDQYARIGLGLIAAFLVVRGLNVYGDPVPWTGGLLSFLRCNKYPPSLSFLLMTLGPAILLLSRLERAPRFLLVFGRVPLFYFVAHLFLIHGLAKLAAVVRYGRADFFFVPVPSMGGDPRRFPPDFGYDLWVVYAVWAAVVAMLYPACRWFGALKQRRTEWWLSYL